MLILSNYYIMIYYYDYIIPLNYVNNALYTVNGICIMAYAGNGILLVDF